MNFIRTQTKPHVFYMPKKQNAESEKKHDETRKILEGEFRNDSALCLLVWFV